jgi:signal transduction histidine kinase
MKNTLKWKFDVSTFRLIGRGLITDRITALFELVKNSYDANAQNVIISLIDVRSISSKSSIIIEDDGLGMSFEDIRDKWMVIGTSHKRSQEHSPAPYNRKHVGEKGIGRFAVDKLGDNLVISTKQEGSDEKLIVNINWKNYEDLLENKQLTLFTDIDNKYSFQKDSIVNHGTKLEITGIREEWTKSDISRLKNELDKIVSPFYPLNPPFNIFIHSNEYEELDNKQPIHSDITKYATVSKDITYNKDSSENSYQEVLKFNEKSGQIDIVREKIKIFGGVNLKIFYFDQKAKKALRVYGKISPKLISGIKIYRDNIITTPFAETEEEPDKQRDVLKIHQRLWQGIFDKITTRDLVGILDITRNENSNIVDATNRQDFEDNEYYRKLKEFVVSQIIELEKFKKYNREENKYGIEKDLQKAKDNVDLFAKQLDVISNKITDKEAIAFLKTIKNETKTLKQSVSKGIELQKLEQKEFKRKENIYLSLISLQEFAAELAHAVRNVIHRTKGKAEFFVKNYPNPNLEKYFKSYSKEIYNELEQLLVMINFMLSYAQSTKESFEEFNVVDLTENVFKTHKFNFQSDGVITNVRMEDCMLFGNKKFFEEILIELLSNSLKFLEEIEEKKILCEGFIENDKYIITFSDNGTNIPLDNRDKVFDIFFTTSEEKGGGGLGLWIVKSRVEALKGSVKIVDSVYKTGTSVEVTFPFKPKRNE